MSVYIDAIFIHVRVQFIITLKSYDLPRNNCRTGTISMAIAREAKVCPKGI